MPSSPFFLPVSRIPFSRGNLFGLGGDNDFTAYIVRDIVSFRKIKKVTVPPLAIQGFGPAGRIVNARVDDPAVMAGLMPGYTIFLFDHCNTQARLLRCKLIGSSQTDYAGTDYGNIVLHQFFIASLKYKRSGSGVKRPSIASVNSSAS